MHQHTYQTQDVLLEDLRLQQAIQLASALCCTSVQKHFLLTLTDYEDRRLSSSSLILAYNQGRKTIRVGNGHCGKSLRILRNALRTIISGIKGSSDIPLFDESLFSDLVSQMRRIHLNPDFATRLFSMAEVVFTECTDISQRTIESHYSRKRLNTLMNVDELSGSTYFNCLSSLSFTRAKSKEDKLMNILMKINSDLISKVAYPYFNKGLCRDTATSAGQLGLFRAIRRHNVDLGNQLSTTAVPWIKQMVLEEFPRQAVVSLPYRLAQKFNRMQTLVGTNPSISDDELASHLKLRSEEVTQLRATYDSVISLDAITDDGDYNNFMPSADLAPEELLEEESSLELIHNLIDGLEEIEKAIILTDMGYQSGFDSLKAICTNYDITMSTIENRRKRALCTMREALGDLELEDLLKAS